MNSKSHFFRCVLAAIAAGMLSFAPAWGQVSSENSPPVPVVELSADAPAEPAACKCDACKAKGCTPKTCTTKTCCHGHLVDWSKVPGSIRIFPRPGNFPVPPTGCGYYSLSDHLHGQLRDKPPKSGYPAFALMPPSLYDADFRYVDTLPYADRTLVERMKRIHLNDCWTVSTGGQFWARYMNEHNSRLTESDNDYLLSRVRLFGDVMYGENIRFYGEFIWADAFEEDLPALPIDVNRGDILNMFVDLALFDYDGHPVYARVGRQELMLGSQRLVSGLDWANTRRTFEGVRVFRQGEKWDFDLFWTQFVPAQADSFDKSDNQQDFAGAWLTHRPKKGHFLDFYYLMLDNSNTVTQQQIVRYPSQVHSIGTRYAGDKDGLLWDTELVMQFGNQNGEDLFAGAATAGVGRRLKSAPMSPTAWVYYDYASGDASPNSGTSNTFNQLYPFGHYYLGWIDLVGRQNVHDLNAHLYLYPESWITVMLQYHHFWLNQSRDALYNAGGVAIRRDPTGNSGTNVGDEIDIVLNFHLNRNSDLMVGYSRLFGGGFLEASSGPGRASDSELFHLMYQTKW